MSVDWLVGEWSVYQCVEKSKVIGDFEDKMINQKIIHDCNKK